MSEVFGGQTVNEMISEIFSSEVEWSHGLIATVSLWNTNGNLDTPYSTVNSVTSYDLEFFTWQNFQRQGASRRLFATA